jgi:Mn2+/Fe2+ NRAMP family transporter
LLAAASNNDPTTVAALAVIGATTGYTLCWLVFLIIPVLTLVQTLAADVGAVCKTSLQGVIRLHYGIRWAILVVCLIAAVDTVTLAADVKAGTEALSLLTRVPSGYWLFPVVCAAGWLLISRTFKNFERSLSWLCVVFVCYVASAIAAHFDIGVVLRSIFRPQLPFSPLYASAVIALLGTTLTSYVYVWESIGVADRGVNGASIKTFEKDAAAGMLGIGVVFVFILIASAATLGRHHVAVQTASDMALALEPLAGPLATTLFSIGLLASAILAVPVLASVNAYAVAHTFGWPGSLNSRVADAKAFYGVALVSLAVAALIACSPVSSIVMLYWASIAGGLATPVTLVFLMLVAGNRRIMGAHCMRRPIAVTAWLATFAVTAAGVGFLVSLCVNRG